MGQYCPLKQHYFNPLPLCRGRLRSTNHIPQGSDISILSLYAEGDNCSSCKAHRKLYFNPLPLCRGRPTSNRQVSQRRYFNPLPLCRGRRDGASLPARSSIDFNPLPLCRGRPRSRCRSHVLDVFQSSPSMQRETGVMSTVSPPPLRNFNPLPLCRGRHNIIKDKGDDKIFQSSPSMQRETRSIILVKIFCTPISILSLYAEGDYKIPYCWTGHIPISILSLYAEGDDR